MSVTRDGRARDRGPVQVVRRARGPQGDRPRGRRARGRLPDRRVGFGEVDAAPVHQPARADRTPGGSLIEGEEITARGRRREPDPPAGRDRVPGVQPVPAHDGAAATSRSGRSRRSGSSKADAEALAHGAARAVRARREARRLPGSALGRAAATRGDRPGARDEARRHAARRGHERAGPRARRRGPERDPGARRRRHDDGDRHPRDGVRPRHRATGSASSTRA